MRACPRVRHAVCTTAARLSFLACSVLVTTVLWTPCSFREHLPRTSVNYLPHRVSYLLCISSPVYIPHYVTTHLALSLFAGNHPSCCARPGVSDQKRGSCPTCPTPAGRSCTLFDSDVLCQVLRAYLNLHSP
ncbi:hypothetical protein BD309DRAFT_645680 [Dichomitus squalens]|nr:hypothetical protein BD309DRAFT_645680 [Dichomitus squalens]